MVYRLEEPGDETKLAALVARARQRGIVLDEPVARYVLTRCGRSSHALFGFLDRLDAVSLSAKRRVTIPFVKALMARDPG